MLWIVYFREVALTLGTITAIIAQAMSQLTLNTLPALVPAVSDLTYANLGVASGVLTILSLPLILLYDMAQERSYTATVAFEIVWSFFLTILWIVSGVKTIPVADSTFKDCNSFLPQDGSTPSATQLSQFGLCGETHTLVQFSLASAGIFAAYALTLTLAAVASASKGKPIWTHFPIPGAKKH